jgi:hypothetical protein
MRDTKNTGKSSGPPKPLSFDDCVLVEGGIIAEDNCRRLSSVIARNTTFCQDCESPWRICTTCIREGKAKEWREVNPKTGLCREHEEILAAAETAISIPAPKSIFEIASEIKKAIKQEMAKNDGRTRKMVIKDLAEFRFKRSEAWALSHLSLFKLDPGIRVFFDPKLSEDKKLKPQTAFCLTVLSARFQNQVAIQAVKKRWTVEQICQEIKKLQRKSNRGPRINPQTASSSVYPREEENSLKNEFSALLRILRKTETSLDKIDKDLLWTDLKGRSETERLAAAAQLESCANEFIDLASLIFPEIKNKTEI